MKKPVGIFALVLATVMLTQLFTGCGKKNDEPANGTELAISDTTATDATTSAVTTSQVTKSESWQEAYYKYLDNIIKISEDNGGSISSNGYFTLIYLDDDDIPELVSAPSTSHVFGAKIFTFADGQAKEIFYGGAFANVYYGEKTGTLVTFDEHNGNSAYGNIAVMKYENGEVKKLESASFRSDDGIKPVKDCVINGQNFNAGEDIKDDIYSFIDSLKKSDDKTNPLRYQFSAENAKKILDTDIR